MIFKMIFLRLHLGPNNWLEAQIGPIFLEAFDLPSVSSSSLFLDYGGWT